MIRLHVNIDHIATIRQARGVTYPDPVWGATLAELAGAHGITAHLREDRRHIQDRDLRLLRQTVKTVLNMEMAATEEMVGIARELNPEIVTLVPERREERTTEGGLDLQTNSLNGAIERLRTHGIRVSLFIVPDPDTVKRAATLGAHTVELHTGEYAGARGDRQREELQRLTSCTELAVSLGLDVAAGHGLDYLNVQPVAKITGIQELNIGHAIIARAVFSGMDTAVRDMLGLMGS